MQIHWFTVVAQAVNFLVLVWLLRRFLYRPVVEAMAKREKTIGEQVQAAQDRETVAQRAELKFDAERAALEAAREQRLREVTEEATRTRLELTGAARHEVAELRRRLQTLDTEERQALAAALAGPDGDAHLTSSFELPDATRHEIEAAASKVLGAEVSLHASLAPRLVCGVELAVGGRKVSWNVSEHLSGLEQQVDEALARARVGE